MTCLRIHLTKPRPFFAEIPYYLWGQVNYDSEGDCGKPTDQQWHSLSLENRDTHERLEIMGAGEEWNIEGENATVARVGAFLEGRSGTGVFDQHTIESDVHHSTGLKWANAVAREFSSPELGPFDSHDFWGSWKWIGWFGTDFTWVGRWIMHAVVRKDPRAVSLCIHWLKTGTYSKDQSAALRYALNRLTGFNFPTDKQWVKWYEGGLFSRGNRKQYPEANTEEWLVDLKRQTVEIFEDLNK